MKLANVGWITEDKLDFTLLVVLVLETDRIEPNFSAVWFREVEAWVLLRGVLVSWLLRDLDRRLTLSRCSFLSLSRSILR
jgi:hypothetical protein